MKLTQLLRRFDAPLENTMPHFVPRLLLALLAVGGLLASLPACPGEGEGEGEGEDVPAEAKENAVVIS